MPPKKSGNKPGAEPVEGEDPQVLLANYQKYCKSTGININPSIVRLLNDEEKYPIEQILLDDDSGILGPGGTRALMTALMGTGVGMKGGPYKKLKSLRLWGTHCSDDGAAAIAEILRLGGADVALQYLELLDNNIGPRGCNALGIALSFGHNVSLLTLKLDYNTSIGTEGVANLCRGLRTNNALKQLHLQYCNLTPEAGDHLAQVLANTRTNLELLNVSGNRLGGAGLAALCKGLIMNSKCETLLIADNMIDQDEIDFKGLSALRDCLLSPHVNLTSVDLMFNRIGEVGGRILAEAITPDNTKVKSFLVDITVPDALFEVLLRKAGGKSGKKSGKGGKGKKKK